MTTYRLGFTTPIRSQFGLEFVLNENWIRQLAFGDGARAKNKTHTRPPKSYLAASAGDLKFGSGTAAKLERTDGNPWTDTDFPTHMFEIGDSVTISGSVRHDGTYTVDSFEGTSEEIMVFASNLPTPSEHLSTVGNIVVMVTPALFDGYIVNGTGTEQWAGQDDAHAVWAYKWLFYGPEDGQRVWLQDTSQKALRHSGSWVFI